MYQTYRLRNGIRLIHRPTTSHVAHCGIFINAGSRDEAPDEQGIAHLIEHVIFKGTAKRKAFQILSHMENVGGEINAFTSKEDTCIYASFMYPHYTRWFDLISDILFHSVFPEKEIKKEKDVVLDEINACLDSPAEQIFDDFDELIFNDHPLGRNILGTPESLRGITRDKIHRFIRRNYVTGEMLICSVGRMDFTEFVKAAENCFGFFPASEREGERKKFADYSPLEKVLQRKNHQAHCIVGNKAYSLHNNKKTALALLSNLLGGPGLNSRLNMSVREKHGFCYNIESHYQAFSDAGIVSIYFGTDSGYTGKTLSLIRKELKLLRTKKLGTLQLSRAKLQLMGQIAISFESPLNEMFYNGKNFLNFEKTDSLTDINRRIEAVEAGDLLEVANEVFEEEVLSTLMYKP